MPAIIRNGRNYSGGGSDITKEDIVKMGFYELPEGGIPAKDLAEGVIPTIPESLPASDVPSWAKQPTKPSYTASEVGALSADGKAADSNKLDGHDSDYFATATSVTALGEDVDTLAYGETHGGKNLVYWTSKSPYMQITNGTEITYTNNTSETVYPITEWVDLPQGTYTFSCTIGVSNAIYIQRTEDVYDKYISDAHPTEQVDIASGGRVRLLCALSANASYSFKIQVEKGSSASPYEPYIKSNTVLTEDVDTLAYGETHGGRNLLNIEDWLSSRGAKYSKNGNSYTITVPALIHGKPYEIGTEDKARTISGSISGMATNARIDLLNASGSLVSAFRGDTVTATFSKIRINFGDWGDVILSNIQIEESSYASPYEPYIASNAQLTESAENSVLRDAELQTLGWYVPSEMLIKNGFSNGVLTQYVNRLDLGTVVMNKVLMEGLFSLENPSETKTTVFMSKYSPAQSWPDLIATDKTYAKYSDGAFYIHDSSYSNAQQLQNAMKGVYLYYELATPITHNITDMPSQKSMISDEWNSTKTYVVGEYAIHNNTLWKCKVQNVGQLPAENSYWTAVTVGNEIGAVNRDLNNLHSYKQELVASTQTAYFNADTDRNDTSARADAVKAMIHDRNLNVKSFYVSAIRYRGGYYYNYLVFPMDMINLYVVEFTGTEIHSFEWGSRTDTATYLGKLTV